MKLPHVKVEETDLGDHYDPEAKVVRLSRSTSTGARSRPWSSPPTRPATPCRTPPAYPPLQARTRLAKQAIRAEKVGAVVMLAAPIVMALAKAPYLLVIEVFAGVMLLRCRS
jgi:Zn-dependent membrane protease YugP